MPRRVKCFICQTAINVPDNYSDATIRCSGCGSAVTIPGGGSQSSKTTSLLDDELPSALTTSPSSTTTSEAPLYTPSRKRVKTEGGLFASLGKAVYGVGVAIVVVLGILGKLVGNGFFRAGARAARHLNEQEAPANPGVGVPNPNVNPGPLGPAGNAGQPVDLVENDPALAARVEEVRAGLNRTLASLQSYQSVADGIVTELQAKERAGELGQHLCDLLETTVAMRNLFSNLPADQRMALERVLNRQPDLMRIRSDVESRLMRMTMRPPLHLRGTIAMHMPQHLKDRLRSLDPNNPIANSIATNPRPITPPVVTPTVPSAPPADSVASSASAARPSGLSAASARERIAARQRSIFGNRENQSPFPEKADSALNWKHNGTASDYLRAEQITADDRALLENLRWCAALKRPVLSVYWGIGLELIGIRQSPHSPSPPHSHREVPLELQRYARPARLTVPTQNFIYHEMEEVLGPILPELAGGLQSRINNRVFGDWGLKPGDLDHGLGMIGISLIPSRGQAQHIEIARNLGMDAFVLAHVERKQAGLSRNSGTATLKLRIIDVYNNKVVWESRALSSTELTSQKKDGPDNAVEFVNEFFKFVDGEVGVRDLPSIKASAVPKRAAKIADSRPEAALSALAELRYYVLKKLLTPEDALPLYQKLLGEEPGKLFASDSAADRREAILHLIPDD